MECQACGEPISKGVAFTEHEVVIIVVFVLSLASIVAGAVRAARYGRY